MSVQVLSQAHIKGKRKLESPHLLGPFDFLVHHSIPTSVVFVYDHLDVSRVRSAVERLVEYYPHFTGRLAVQPDGSVLLEGENGVLVIEAKCDERLESPHSSSLPGNGNDVLPTWDVASINPTFSIQATTFACGSVVLGIRIPHCVCDGDGFFQVARKLAALYRGDEVVKPRIESYMGGLQPPPSSPPRYYTLTPEVVSFTPPPVTSGRIMRFSGAALARIKEEASGKGWVTTFETLAALLHQAVYRARRETLGDLTPLDYLSPVNYRARLGLGDEYCANGLITAIQTFTPSELDGPLDEVAQTLHTLFRERIPLDAELEDTLRWISSQPDKSKIASHFRYGTGSLMLSTWAKFDMYSGMTMDGVPRLVALPFTPVTMIDGLGYFLPVPGEPGAIDVHLALDDRVWKALEAQLNTNATLSQVYLL